MRGLAVVFGVALLSFGCGESVVLHQGSGGGASTGASTTASSGGATASSTGTGPATNLPCGVGQPPCPPDEYCDIPGEVCDIEGSCTPRPSGCPEDCPGACGCDGQMYCNVCEAQASGTDATSGTCGGMVEYAAAAMPGGLDHIVVMKADYGANTCWRIYIDAPVMTSLYNISVPAPWGIGGITATNDATNCVDWQLPQQGQQGAVFIATGSIGWQLFGGMTYPCELDIQATAGFEDPPPPNLPLSDSFSAQAISVEGGCF